MARQTPEKPYPLPDYQLVNRAFRVVLCRRHPEMPLGEINATVNDLLRALYKLVRYAPTAARRGRPGRLDETEENLLLSHFNALVRARASGGLPVGELFRRWNGRRGRWADDA